MKTWLEAHRRVKVVATDQWYLDFVNELLPLVAEDVYKSQDLRSIKTKQRAG